MRILILTQWYPPEPQEFLAEMAQSLQRLGHDVTVLTGFPNWPSGKVYAGYRIKPWQHESLDGIRVIRVALYPDHSQSSLKRMLNYASFALSATLLAPWLVGRSDVIHVVPPVTAAVPAWLLSRLWGVPFTHEVQDIWPETLSATGMLSNKRVLAAVGELARWVYRQASAIRVITRGFKGNLMAKGVPGAKIRVIPNWVDTDFYRPLEPCSEMSVELALAGRFNVMYAGSMGPAQGLKTILEAAELLKGLPEVQIVFVGDGLDRPHLEAIVRARSLDNVRFLGRYPGKVMPQMYALADVLLVHLRHDPLFQITIPHKLYTYLASGKPVLGAVEGDAAEVIEAAHAGLTCPPSNPYALAEAIRRFYSMTPQERNALGQNGRNAACDSYGREHLVTQLADMLESVTRGHRRNRDTVV